MAGDNFGRGDSGNIDDGSSGDARTWNGRMTICNEKSCNKFMEK